MILRIIPTKPNNSPTIYTTTTTTNNKSFFLYLIYYRKSEKQYINDCFKQHDVLTSELFNYRAECFGHGHVVTIMKLSSHFYKFMQKPY